MSGWFLYWVLMLDKFSGISEVICIVAMLSFILLGLIFLVSKGCREDALANCLPKPIKLSAIVCIVSSVFWVFVPDTKDVAVIYVVPRVANSEFVQEIPNKLLQLSNEWLEELRPEQNKEGEKTSSNTQKAQSEKESD